jgi:hypothetical protein
VDKLEQKIRAKVAAKTAMLDEKNRIDVLVSNGDA